MKTNISTRQKFEEESSSHTVCYPGCGRDVSSNVRSINSCN